ncbi:chemotaxis protein CheB [Methylobacillus flagellatus]|uniref:protein-glutamate methylesterase n=1 Tax=Methylobacillus flagellatus (strain ATCC 51484 / DSM 6875 / VKM B-1610 / KT) TaxID=265072 RepID=Q1GY33_METFK|nr:chemotaxis protein CheB [Methylobacillus flagellatus]ABE50854.1 CheB methylesterase [Methylobacillus flagellatus KT]
MQKAFCHLLQQRMIRAVVIGASAGGVNAMLKLFHRLPARYPMPIVALLHMQHMRDSRLPELFQHHLRMPVKEAEDKEEIAPGTLYFAPPGYHLAIEHNLQFSLSCEAPLHFSRPAIDILMESAADAYADTLLGILLTGANPDGAAGLRAVKQAGGLSVVQDPDEAEIDYMPRAAISLQQPDLVLRLADIEQLLISLGETYVH